MTSNKGWVKVYRQLVDNQIWKEQPFAKGQAWIDLLLMANYKDDFYMMGNQNVKIETGEIFTSLAKLAERWGWSRKRVKAFLGQLSGLEMVSFRVHRTHTIIRLLNWQIFQDDGEQTPHHRPSSAPPSPFERPTIAPPSPTIKNNKNIKKDKNIRSSSCADFFSKEKNRRLNATEQRAIAKLVETYGEAKTMQALEIAVFKGKGLDYARGVLKNREKLIAGETDYNEVYDMGGFDDEND